MLFLTFLIYFIIGFVVGLFVYDYYCRDFNKKNKNRQFKLTWSEYARNENPGFSMAIAMCLWPILLLIAVCYYMFQYPINCIKKRYGIK